MRTIAGSKSFGRGASCAQPTEVRLQSPPGTGVRTGVRTAALTLIPNPADVYRERAVLGNLVIGF